MRWSNGRRSSNIEDRRGMRISRKATGGGIGVVVIALIALYFGIDPTVILNQQGSPGVDTSTFSVSNSSSPDNQQLVDFVSVVLGDTEDTWHELFRRMNFDEFDSERVKPECLTDYSAKERQCLKKSATANAGG